MVHCHSRDARRKRRDRAVRLGYIVPRTAEDDWRNYVSGANDDFCERLSKFRIGKPPDYPPPRVPQDLVLDPSAVQSLTNSQNHTIGLLTQELASLRCEVHLYRNWLLERAENLLGVSSPA